MAIGHLKSCECSECAADRAVMVTSGRPAELFADGLPDLARPLAELPGGHRNIADDFEAIKREDTAKSIVGKTTDIEVHNAMLRDILDTPKRIERIVDGVLVVVILGPVPVFFVDECQVSREEFAAILMLLGVAS